MRIEDVGGGRSGYVGGEAFGDSAGEDAGDGIEIQMNGAGLEQEIFTVVAAVGGRWK
jgi:hypothetical protein